MNRTLWPVLVAATVGMSTSPGAQTVIRDRSLHESGSERIPIGTSTICGTVTTAAGRPVPGALVTVSGLATNIGPGGTKAEMSRQVLTDAAGGFAFPRMPAGLFRITISPVEDQFDTVEYGQVRPGGRGQTIKLADGQRVSLPVVLARAAVITGTVFGPDGTPQQNVEVLAHKINYSDGFKRLQDASTVRTDDRGVYRIFGLGPGDYIVSATPRATGWQQQQRGLSAAHVEHFIRSAPGAPKTGAATWIAITSPRPEDSSEPDYLPTYSPSSMTPAGATVLTVSAGEERTGIDVHTRTVQASMIKGVVSTPLDSDVGVKLYIWNDDPSADSRSRTMVGTGKDGVFFFYQLAPGDYTIVAQTFPPSGWSTTTLPDGKILQTVTPRTLTDEQRLWGRTKVSVGPEQQAAVTIALQPSRSVSGVVVFETDSRPDFIKERWEVSASSAMSVGYYPLDTPRAIVGPDGRFTLKGVPPGHYEFRVSGQAHKSSIVSGQDTLDFPLEFTGDRDVTGAVLTITDRCNELFGTLTDSSGQPATDYTIIVAASDPRFWREGSRRIKVTEPDLWGRYYFRDLPPGSYQLSVVNDLEPWKQYDPEFLRTIAITSVPITIGDGAKVTQNLRVK